MNRSLHLDMWRSRSSKISCDWESLYLVFPWIDLLLDRSPVGSIGDIPGEDEPSELDEFPPSASFTARLDAMLLLSPPTVPLMDA